MSDGRFLSSRLFKCFEISFIQRLLLMDTPQVSFVMGRIAIYDHVYTFSHSYQRQCIEVDIQFIIFESMYTLYI